MGNSGRRQNVVRGCVHQAKQNRRKVVDESRPTPFDSFTPTGGLYVAKNIGLAEFVAFAYKLTNKQLASFESRVPWSLDDLFDIEARVDGNPTKNQ